MSDLSDGPGAQSPATGRRQIRRKMETRMMELMLSRGERGDEVDLEYKLQVFAEGPEAMSLNNSSDDEGPIDRSRRQIKTQGGQAGERSLSSPSGVEPMNVDSPRVVVYSLTATDDDSDTLMSEESRLSRGQGNKPKSREYYEAVPQAAAEDDMQPAFENTDVPQGPTKVPLRRSNRNLQAAMSSGGQDTRASAGVPLRRSSRNLRPAGSSDEQDTMARAGGSGVGGSGTRGRGSGGASRATGTRGGRPASDARDKQPTGTALAKAGTLMAESEVHATVNSADGRYVMTVTCGTDASKDRLRTIMQASGEATPNSLVDYTGTQGQETDDALKNAALTMISRLNPDGRGSSAQDASVPPRVVRSEAGGRRSPRFSLDGMNFAFGECTPDPELATGTSTHDAQTGAGTSSRSRGARSFNAPMSTATPSASVGIMASTATPVPSERDKRATARAERAERASKADVAREATVAKPNSLFSGSSTIPIPTRTPIADHTMSDLRSTLTPSPTAPSRAATSQVTASSSARARAQASSDTDDGGALQAALLEEINRQFGAGEGGTL